MEKNTKQHKKGLLLVTKKKKKREKSLKTTKNRKVTKAIPIVRQMKQVSLREMLQGGRIRKLAGY